MRSVAAAILTVSFVLLLAGAGTLAYFSDEEVSAGNFFRAGTFDDLKVADDDEAGDGVTETWVMSNMKPGDEIYGFIDFDVVIGDVHASNLKIECDYTINDTKGPESDVQENTDADSMAKYILITYARYQDATVDIDLLTGCNEPDNICTDDWKINDVDGDGKITLYDLKNDPVTNLPPPDSDQYTLKMRVKFDENAGNEFQGDVLTATFYFTIEQ